MWWNTALMEVTDVLSSAPPPGLEPHRKFDGKVSTVRIVSILPTYR